MSSPLVSVIMPVYNAESFLREAIDSVLNQTYSNLELLVVNDGSSDGSKEIILSYTDPRLRYLENEANMGLIKTKNKAIDLAKGKYIASLDADDIALPQRLEKQVDFLEKNPDHGLCGTRHIEIDGQGKHLWQSNFPDNDKDVRTYLALANCFCHSSVMVNSHTVSDLKYAAAYEVAEDYELWHRISRHFKITNLPEALVLYRVHGNNVSITRKEKMFDTVKKLASSILAELPVDFTPEELEIHSKFLSYSGDFFKDPQQFAALEKWVTKLYNAVKGKDNFNQELFFKLLADRWIVSCHQTRRFHKLLFNTLLPLRTNAYLHVLRHKIFKTPVRF